MTEIELKFQVSAERRAAVAAAVAGRSGAEQVQRLQAAYHDTAERSLAAAGVALRLRREGPRWVQTLKAGGADALTRLEHNVERPGRSAAVPPLDLSLHDGTPAGARLAEVLEAHASSDPEAVLACQFRTDVRRVSRTLRWRGAVLELAFDEGRVVASARSQPLCELEIELLRGSPAALVEAARHWVARHGLWLDTRSKAERGDLLARGLPYSPARKAEALRLEAGMPAAAARRAVLQCCAQQVLPNASQVASGVFGDEHLHQLRVGLRRLRAALSLFDTHAAPLPLAAASTALFRALGAARDRAAIGAPLREQLERAIATTGVALVAPSLPEDAAADPAETVRAAPAQDLLLGLLASTLAPDAPDASADAGADAAPLKPQLTARLDRWHRQASRAGRDFASLDDAARHRLRKRIKRLRYAVEFAQGLYGGKKTARYLRALGALQERLGALNDVAVALAAFRGAPADDAAAVFALGWLAARREALAADCVPAMRHFARAKRPWKD